MIGRALPCARYALPCCSLLRRSPAQEVSDAELQKRADAILALMGFSLVPDVTTGALSISDQSAGNPYFRQTSIAGGGRPKKDVPLYLEGTLAYGRYDPTFAVGESQVPVSVQWESLIGDRRRGLGLPDRAASSCCARSSTSRLDASRARLRATPPAAQASSSRAALDFLGNGRLNATGVGGSLMLDYERYRPENEVDVELRYSNIRLQSFDSSQAVQGHASAQTVSLWSRYRAPTGFTALERPLRYVLEYAYTSFLADLRGVLGFDDVHSFGAGVELDSSNHDVYVTRTRLLVRYKIGNNVTGWALGLAVSF